MKIKVPTKSKETSPSTNKYETIREKYVAVKNDLKKIENIQQSAFDRMFEFGELLLKHEKEIKNDYSTWGNYAEDQGLDQSFISRCKKSVADFKRHGADTLDKARDLLKERKMKPTAKLMERNVNALLENHQKRKKKTPKEQSVKKERHINELRDMADRAEEIVSEHEPDDELYQEAIQIKNFVDDTVKHVQSLDISQKEWNSREYLNFCRKICFDVVLGEPVEQSEPMHISPDGESGSMGGKVADFFAVPGCRDTHNKLDNDKLEVTRDEIAHWHRWTMAMFLFNTMASDYSDDEIKNMEEAKIVE